jgi:hypothetical protein
VDVLNDRVKMLLLNNVISYEASFGAAYETSANILGTVAGKEASISYLSIDYMG